MIYYLTKSGDRENVMLMALELGLHYKSLCNSFTHKTFTSNSGATFIICCSLENIFNCKSNIAGIMVGTTEVMSSDSIVKCKGLIL
jgi:hypothetical protein